MFTVQKQKLYLYLGLAILLIGCGGPTPTAIPQPAPKQTEQPIITAPEFDLQAHRGGRSIRPENTLPAFEYALDLQVTTLELDLHLTQDGVVVITHNPAIGGNCRLDPQALDPQALDPQALGPQVAGDIVDKQERRISQLTLKQIKLYLCDQNPNPQRFPEQQPLEMPLTGQNYHIPTLSELFQFTLDYAQSPLKSEAQQQRAANIRFNIETKRDPSQPQSIGDDFDGETPGLFEKQIVETIEQFNLTDRVTIQSFDHRSINVIKQLNPAIQTVALTARPADPTTISQTTSAQIWSPNQKFLTAQALNEAHNTGLLVIPWTVNDPTQMETLIELGVDGLITDYPAVLADILDARAIEY